MTWGSNASYDSIPCPYCGAFMIDDADSGESSHMKVCTWRSPVKYWLWRLFRWRIGPRIKEY